MKAIRVILALIIVIFSVVVQTQFVKAQTATRLGGMNLDGYCSNLNAGGASLNGNTWQCDSGAAINMSAACQWQYATSSATAVQEIANNSFSWACYSGNTAQPTATPTPTQAVTPTATNAPTPTPTRAITQTPTPTPNQTGSTIIIFSDALASGWSDASYNATNTIVSSPVASGSAAISTRINADGGFDVQAVTAVPTGTNMTVHFMLRATQANQRYEVYADSTYGQPLRAPVSLANYAGQPTATGWTTYDIPLSDLSANNVNLRDIVIHDATGTNQQVLYVDELQLRTPNAATTPTPTPTRAATPTPTNGAIPTATPTATPTPTVRPTVTSTPTPTPTIRPTATPTSTILPTATPTPVASGSSMIVYGDALATGWSDASYNATNTSVTTPVFSGTNAISSRINANGGFDIQSVNGQITSSSTSLHFALRATQANQQYEVYADTQYGQPLRAPVSLASFGGQPTSIGWTSYDIPLSTLGATGVMLKDIVIHDATGTNQAVLYVDDVELRSASGSTTPTPTPTTGATPTITPTPTASTSGVIVRKSIYDLTPTELTRLANALNTMKANGTYQDFMNRHQAAMSTLTPTNETGTQRNVAHRGPAFLPWHRAFVWEFEQALRRVDPTVTLPYWPFEQDASAANAGQLPKVFTAAYFGGDGNRSRNNLVTDGPFTSWNITREIGRDPQGMPTLPTQSDINAMLQLTTYDASPYDEQSSGFRNAIEGWVGNEGEWSGHNRVHAYIGGDMAGNTNQNIVNDPIFFLLHADIDRLWWQWQQQHGQNTYAPTSGGPTGHNLNDVMQDLPEGFTPAGTMSTQSMGYTYQ
ncbi:MAG: tyrosinase family protein [Candidatus Levyibacteriota bacterium]